MDISTTPYVQIYTHLKAYEPHAKKTLKKQEQSTSIVDPLAYVAHTTSAPVLSSSSTSSPQPTAQSSNDALMATMTQIANLLSGFQKQFPPTNNQARTSSNSTKNIMLGAMMVRLFTVNRFREGIRFLADVECTAPYDQPQALTTTNMFQANHEDAYDSDVDEGPNAAVAFMANLSSTKVEHLDSDAETEIDDQYVPELSLGWNKAYWLHANDFSTVGSCDQQALETDRIQLRYDYPPLGFSLMDLRHGSKGISGSSNCSMRISHAEICTRPFVAHLCQLVDDYTRFGWVRFLRSKDETPQAIEKFIVKTQRALNATVRFVRTDNGTEFVNKTLDGWFESVGISHETSVPRSPQQNGVVERRNRTLMEAARTMLIYAKAPLFLWAEAVATACYTLNRSLVHTLHGKTYYELLKGKKPNLQYFRVFGSLCYPTNDYDDVGKLKAKADIGIFVGYAPTKKAYRIYNKRTRKIQETIHVTFDELTEGLTSVQTSSGLAPQQMTSVTNSTELELTALQSGRSRSALVKDPEPPTSEPLLTK
ncbi:retrovirus-related pol polyprotein from transposon TNT 1-94 [Tanacetum coccineum]|uniref:Retrovirus-related pol polyprotein from transposon TNT 1-94 n=1 Tax=Tanacetum coccineum TaxID=301880 RepID=A0ABQ5B910_9ASTR